MNEISPYANEEDEQLGLDVYNAVWPYDRLGLEEERSYRASLRDHVDLLARVDGDVGGSALGAIQPEWPELVFALVSVLPSVDGGVPAPPSTRPSPTGPASAALRRSTPSWPTTTTRAWPSRSGAVSPNTAAR